MLIIAPVKPFLVDKHLNNPSDTGTYYCRATITNSISGVVLATFNLTDYGNKYFAKEWVTPNDASGTGLQITVSITVYDDAGYTTESVVYGTDKVTYIVRDLAGTRVMGGYAGPGGRGGVGTNIDYSLIKRMIDEAVAKIVIPEQKEFEQEKYDDSSIHDRLDEIENCILVLNEKPEPEDKSEEVVEKILSAPEFKLLRELPEGFKEAEKSDDELHAFIKDFTEEINAKIENNNKELLEIVGDKLDEIIDRPVPIEFSVKKSDKFSERPEPKEKLPTPREMAISKLINGY